MLELLIAAAAAVLFVLYLRSSATPDPVPPADAVRRLGIAIENKEVTLAKPYTMRKPEHTMRAFALRGNKKPVPLTDWKGGKLIWSITNENIARLYPDTDGWNCKIEAASEGTVEVTVLNSTLGLSITRTVIVPSVITSKAANDNHLKTGQRATTCRTGVSTPTPGDQASAFWFASSAVRISERVRDGEADRA